MLSPTPTMSMLVTVTGTARQTAMVRTVMQTMVPMLLAMMMLMRTDIRTSRLGASLRDRATLPSPLRGLVPSGGYPSRLRSLRSLRTPFARRLAALPAECRADTVVATFDGTGSVTAVSSSPRRYAPRSSRNSPRSPWPAAPATGFASARRRRTPCGAGAGFAVHQAPHRAVPSCPHKCGHFRRRSRRRAPHDPVHYPRHLRPLKRRGGCALPGSPVSISPTLMQQAWPFRTARGGLGSHTPRSSLQGMPWRPMSARFGDFRRLWAPGECWTERMLWSMRS